MKNILLATTALVMSAGFASAEITFSGTATAGWAKDGGATKASTDDGDNLSYTEVNITAAASVTTDAGLTLGTAMSIDGGVGYNFADDDTFDGSKSNGVALDNVTIAGAMGKLTIDGNNNGTTGGNLAMLVDADDESGDIAYTGTFGEMTLNVVADVNKDPKTDADVAWSAAVSTTIAGVAVRVAGDEESAYAASAGYSVGGMSVTLATKKEAAAVNTAGGKATNSIALGYTLSNGLGLTYGANSDNDGNDYSYGVSYTVDGLALAYSSDEAEKWTTSVSYDLGGGASAVAQQNYTGDSQVGVSFSF